MIRSSFPFASVLIASLFPLLSQAAEQSWQDSILVSPVEVSGDNVFPAKPDIRIAIDRDYLAAITVVGKKVKIHFKNQTRYKIKPELRLLFLNEYGIGLAEVECSYLFDSLAPGEVKTDERPLDPLDLWVFKHSSLSRLRRMHRMAYVIVVD